ncbi:MAG: DUF4326 domain-containing protein [Cyanobacteria bacterium]|nr:DUF4326 domain-containing protein [Cyanobacteriota bacterium]
MGRPTALGNPFAIGRDGSRAEGIQLYRAWLWRHMQQPGFPQRRALEQLLQQTATGRLELLSWCAPLACHAEVIRSALHWLAAQNQNGG